MSRYTAELLPQLTEETGQDTGFRRIGHLHLASTPQRLETVTREASSPRPTACRSRWSAPAEVAGHVARREGRRHPRRRLGARRGTREPGRRGAGLRQGRPHGRAPRSSRASTVTGFVTAGGRVTGVETDQGSIETETVVVAAGMWGRQLGELAGVSRPAAGGRALLPADRRRRVGAPRPAGGRGPGPLRLLPRGGRRHPRRAVRAEGRAVVARWDPARPRVRRAAARLGPDGRVPLRRDGPVPVAARRRDPAVLLRAGELHRRQRPAARRGARAARVLRRVRAQLARHPAVAAAPARSSRSGSSTASRRWTSRASQPDRTMPFMANRAFREERRVELLGSVVRRRGVPVVATAERRANVRRSRGARPAGRRGRGLHGARRATRCRSGSPSRACRTSGRRAGTRDQSLRGARRTSTAPCARPSA